MEATAQGNVSLEMRLSAGKTNRYISWKFLYAPKLGLSITKVSKVGKVVKFDHASCPIENKVTNYCCSNKSGYSILLRIQLMKETPTQLIKKF